MSRKKIDLLLRSGYCITMAPGDRELRKDYAVAIDRDIIADVGPFEEVSRHYEAGSVITLGNHLLMPGMINTHGHLPMVGYSGKMPDGLPFDDILFQHMLPLERTFLLRENFVYHCTLLGAQELALSGVTTTAEMYYNSREMMRAFSEIGLRAVVGETVLSEFPSPSARSVDESLAYIRETYEGLPRGDHLVEIAVAPHSAYSCNDETLLKCKRLAEELDLPLLMHASETPGEGELPLDGKSLSPSSFYKSRTGVRDAPLVHLGKEGLFDLDRVTLAHCIYLTPGEIDVLARYDVGASYNGVCNTQIGLDIAPVTPMRRAGIPVGIGTDGPLTNDRLDIANQLLPLLCFQRHKSASSDALTCYDLVQMATLEGAGALGISYLTGSLEKGKKADIIGINLENAPRASLYMENSAVYGYIVKYMHTHCIDFSLVNGKKLKIPDERAVLQNLAGVLEEIRSWKPQQDQR